MHALCMHVYCMPAYTWWLYIIWTRAVERDFVIIRKSS